MKIKSKFTISILAIILVISFFSTTGFAAQSSNNSYQTLKVGSRGSAVSKLQQALNSKGFSAGTVDGSYGPKTKNAVIRFQKAKSLIVDGIAGQQTQSVLYSSYPTLKLGSKGSAVSKLQQSLNSNGFSCGSVDGSYGPQTKKAVINFQKAKGLTVDGIAGPQTQGVLYGPSSSNGTSTVSAANSNYSNDLYWLSRIIHAESEGEPYKGKVAVGSVIINRVNSGDFPNTVKGVIFEYYKGIPQFSPVADGSIYNTPSEESIQAAKDALDYVRPVSDATYFFNPDKSAAKWIVENKTYLTRIGRHVFYR